MCSTKAEVLEKLVSAHETLARIHLVPQTKAIAMWSSAADAGVMGLMREVTEQTKEEDWEDDDT